MRNGFNTAGFSEVVHEIRKDPAEAKFVYSARGRRSALTGLTIQVLPALLGTVKSPRQFAFSLRDPWVEAPPGEKHLPTPMDLFLAGIGSCMMTTLVGGASARHLALEGAELDLTPMPRFDASSGGMLVSAGFTLATASEDARCEQLVGRVAEQSPNYVTLVSATPVGIASDAAPSSESVPVGTSVTSRPPARFGDMAVSWISGTQCLARAAGEVPGHLLRADAPKQLTGVDWGPNPQEYLLAGLAAELSSLLFRHSLGTPFEDHAWEVVATGVEDVRGFLGVDPTIEVGLQDVEVRITSPSGAPKAVDDVVSQAIADSEVTALLVNPIEVALSWQRATREGSSTKLALRPGVGE
ncbi:OsmC family protein [Kocuria marina]|uniref:OsmC family protein n=1 Tax=Kocuria marina TaxID=223184 RepID=UPI0011A2F3A3|nr:OsmC family protein [Kocuria indica]